MSKQVTSLTIGKKTVKVGQVVQNRLGQFAKIIAIKGGVIHFAGWFPKKDTASKAENATSFLNQWGLARAMGEADQITNPGESDGKPQATDTNDGEGDDTTGDDGGDGDGDEDGADPFEGVTNKDMQDALRDAGQPTSGNRAELIARCQEAGIEFVEE